MPQKFWKHQCPGKSPYLVGSPRAYACASACDNPMVYDGWHNSALEAAAWSQKFYGLKQMGPHDNLRRRLFAGTTKRCARCCGRGYFDAAGGLAFEVCSHCDGWGQCSMISAELRAMLRAQVLVRFPDAAARSDLPHPAFSIIVNDVGSGELIVTPIPGRH